jgi:hypothetical protein
MVSLKDVNARDRCCYIAAARPEAALVIARGIEDHWYRCQTLCSVADVSKDKRER